MLKYKVCFRRFHDRQESVEDYPYTELSPETIEKVSDIETYYTVMYCTFICQKLFSQKLIATPCINFFYKIRYRILI